ncbi:MAG: Ribosome biogenesis protein erb1 [Alyxoria varia]|nr:MAG: Ribosome biogenesis protein erb1 [Alyxoria varia]
MNGIKSGSKRKAVTHDAPDPQHAPVFDEFGNGPLDGVLSDDDAHSSSEDDQRSSDLFFSAEDDQGSTERSLSHEEQPLPHDRSPRYGPSEPTPREVGGGKGEEDRNDSQSEEDADDKDYIDLAKKEKSYVETTDAEGNPRYIYQDIEPVYDSDDSDAPATTNAIGNIPLSFYDSYPHIGYDINGKRIARPAKGTALDSLLDSIELPPGWTGLTDPATGKPLELNEEQLDVLKRISKNETAGEGYDPYPETIEYFTSKLEPMPLSHAPEPKRRFVPSKHETKRVLKLVKAIKEGRILPYKPPPKEDDEESEARYDVWETEGPRRDHPTYIPAPKLPPPGYDESYHPPPEYLPDEEERKAWEEADEEDRAKNYLPKDHNALRKVGGFGPLTKEKFERALDLYLAPRIRRNRLNMDPSKMLPLLPNASDLRPFPEHVGTIYRGHRGRVRSISVHESGIFATGGDDGTVRFWDPHCTIPVSVLKLSRDEPVYVVKWRPCGDEFILAAAVGDHDAFLIAPHPHDLHHGGAISEENEVSFRDAKHLLEAGFSIQRKGDPNKNTTSTPAATWNRPDSNLRDKNVFIQISFKTSVRDISWHRRGDYFVTVCPDSQTRAIAIHTLSQHLTQLPFRAFKGFAQRAAFHPSKPLFFVASQRHIKTFDLARQELVKTLQPGAKWISAFDVHPSNGDHIIVSSYDRRTLWLDLDLSNRPYKTLRFHSRAVRTTKFHPLQRKFPLFADASDDGTIQVFHAKPGGNSGDAVQDLMENVTITPLVVLRGHEVVNGLGVLDIAWASEGTDLLTAGADGTVRLWQT